MEYFAAAIVLVAFVERAQACDLVIAGALQLRAVLRHHQSVSLFLMDVTVTFERETVFQQILKHAGQLGLARLRVFRLSLWMLKRSSPPMTRSGAFLIDRHRVELPGDRNQRAQAPVCNDAAAERRRCFVGSMSGIDAAASALNAVTN
jgi:hypothetical protein